MFDNLNPLEAFGWQFKKKDSDKKIDAPYTQPSNDDAAFVLGSNYYGMSSHSLSIDQSFTNENELILKYREMSLHPEVDSAINDIVNEAVDGSANSSPVEIVLDEMNQSDKIKEKIREEFERIVRMMNFNNDAYEIFRKWYVDGRIHFQIIIDPKNPSKGIKELRYLSSINIKKIREEIFRPGPGGIQLLDRIDEYYLYAQDAQRQKSVGLKLPLDSVCYVTSGLLDEQANLVQSYLHKSIRPANQLRMIEDAIIIYRLSRAPERRVFYVDVGTLPKNKAEEYLKSVMNRSKNKMVYDAVTGEVKDSKNTLSMMEDFWLPRREGGKGTEVTTLPGGQNLGDIDDIEYFKKKLFQSLNVPVSRIMSDGSQGFNIGRSSEITREEVQYNKFITRLRKKFSKIFLVLLKAQLVLKKVISEDEWELLKEEISFDFLSDTFFSELKNAEILRERLASLSEIEPYIGIHFSKEWVRKEVLNMTEDKIEEMKKQMEEEAKEEPDEDDQGMPVGDGVTNTSAVPQQPAYAPVMPTAQQNQDERPKEVEKTEKQKQKDEDKNDKA